jgi:hypothetical protein
MKMNNHKLIDTDNPITAWSIFGLAIVLLIALISWMGNRDREHQQVLQCPQPGLGQRLIGRGHIEIDNEDGELQCTYSTAPAPKRLVAINSDR